MYKALIRNKWEMDAYAALPHGGDSAYKEVSNNGAMATTIRI